MFELQDTFLHYSFKGYFEIKIDIDNGRSLGGTFSYVSKIICHWVQDKFSQLDIPQKPTTYNRDCINRTVNMYYSWEEKVYAIKTTHSDDSVANRIWITEATIFENDNRLFMAVKNAFTSNESQRDFNYTSYSIPSFVKKIDANVEIIDAGEFFGEPRIINSEDDMFSLCDLICNRQRRLPIIVVSEIVSLNRELKKHFSIDGKMFLDVNKLSKELNFLAHVFYLPNEFQEAFGRHIGNEWNVYNGAVRTFYQGFEEDDEFYKHPIMIPERIMSLNYTNAEGKEYVGGHAFRHKLAHSIKERNLFIELDYGRSAKLFYDDIYRLNSIKIKTKSDDLQEWLDLYKEENERLERVIEETQNARNSADEKARDLDETVRKLGAINSQNQFRISELKRLLLEMGRKDEEEFPSSYEDMAVWIEKRFLGRIELHSRAKRSIKKAEYENVELVCKAIALLGDYYYDVMMGIITWEDYRVKCDEIGVSDTPAGSSGSSQQQQNAFYLHYNGKKCKLERHITKGDSRDSNYCLRIYYFWDDDTSRIVIGYMPDHIYIGGLS